MIRKSRLLSGACVLVAGILLFQSVQEATAQRPVKRPPAKKPALPVREGGPAVPMVGVNPVKRNSALKSAKTIDDLIAKDLARHNLKPNPHVTEEVFVRRAYLTLTGTIPMAAQAESYVSRKAEDKREALIDQLLGSPAHASHQYNAWADTLRLVDIVPADNHMKPYQEYVKTSLRQNKPYDVWVKEMLTAEGHVWDNPAVGYNLRDTGMPLDALNNTVRVFLGTQIGCAQCHDHPFDRWKQKEFYELAAFTYGSDYRKTSNPALGPMMQEKTPQKMPEAGWFYEKVDFDSPEASTARAMFRANRYNFAVNEKLTLRYPKDYAYSNAKPNDVAAPGVLFGKMPDLKGKTRREAFAEWVIADDNPRFARTIVNRFWKQMFGRGLIEPVDDMRDDTVASNPELMAFLESEIKRLDYDLREFTRILCYSDLFRRQVTYDDLPPEGEYHFPGPVLRRMTAEQVWDSLITLTVERPQYSFEFTKGFNETINLDNVKSVQDVLDRVAAYRDYQKQVNEERKKVQYKGQELLPASELRQPLADGHFLRQFGQSNREQIDDSTTEGTVPQLMVMFNGNSTHMMLEEGSVIYKRVVSKKMPEDQIDAMFWCILSRRATPDERALAMNEIRTNGRAGYGNVIWALINTREFLFVQ